MQAIYSYIVLQSENLRLTKRSKSKGTQFQLKIHSCAGIPLSRNVLQSANAWYLNGSTHTTFCEHKHTFVAKCYPKQQIWGKSNMLRKQQLSVRDSRIPFILFWAKQKQFLWLCVKILSLKTYGLMYNPTELQLERKVYITFRSYKGIFPLYVIHKISKASITFFDHFPIARGIKTALCQVVWDIAGGFACSFPDSPLQSSLTQSTHFFFFAEIRTLCCLFRSFCLFVFSLNFLFKSVKIFA